MSYLRNAFSPVFNAARAAYRNPQTQPFAHNPSAFVQPFASLHPRTFSTSRPSAEKSGSSRHAAATSASTSTAAEPQTELQFKMPEPRLSLTFTCTVVDCSTRSTHEFARRSYEKGIVIVECPGCKNRHLIADHLGWFKESTEDGKLKTVEDLVRAKGERVRRGTLGAGGVVEYTPE